MVELFKKLFSIDWLVIETFSQDFGSILYNKYNGLEFNNSEKIETSYYYVEYSKSRNKVRIRKENANHITKTAYQDAINYRNAINKELLNGKDITEILTKI